MFDYINLNSSDLKISIIILVIAILALVITRKLLKLSFPYFFMGLLGLAIGLIVGSLFAVPLSRLPGEYGRWIPLVVNIFVAVAVLDLFLAHAKSTSAAVTKLFSRILKLEEKSAKDEIIVDTSVLIDGRIQSIADTGFLTSKLIIPRFVLHELQLVADSEDSLKRSRGRRGLEVLTSLQKDKLVTIEIYEKEHKPQKKVDLAVIYLAKEKDAKILTVDYNLNRIAQIEGVQVLNINELAESLKPILIPGEEISVKVIQKGKEKNQGVGYLSDGTMIVIENGSHFVGETIQCQVIRIFHTVAGKMIFVEPKKNK